MEKIIQLPPAITAVIEYDFKTGMTGTEIGNLPPKTEVELKPIVSKVTFLQPRYAKNAVTLNGHSIGLLVAAVAEIKALPSEFITREEWFH